jgi:hypothetical protein
MHRFEESPAAPQPIHPGSYVSVERGLDPILAERGLSAEVWVKPWNSTLLQGVISEHDGNTGWGLFLDADGNLALQLDGRIFIGPLPARRRWTHVAAAWDRDRVVFWVDGERAGERHYGRPLSVGRARLRIGAAGAGDQAAHFLDADIAMPALFTGFLGDREVRERFLAGGLRRPVGGKVLACWPLCEERGESVQDCSGYGRNGTIINHATWMIGGPSWSGKEDPIFSDNGYDPFADPDRGHGLRFASDDLVDCRWKETHRFDVPRDAKSGIYVGRMEYLLGGDALVYDITFIVKPPLDAAPAGVLVLCATNSWLAYNSTPFMKNIGPNPVWPRRAVGLEAASPEAPKYGSYTYHRGGQPSYYTGLRMPWPNASPDALYAPEGTSFGQWARMERHLHVWLDAEGYEYHVVADCDVDRDPELLKSYRTVVIAGHSEYWSIRALEGLDAFLRGGGSAVVLSGNTMYMRVSFDGEYTVMEQRKSGPEGDVLGPPAGPFREQYHSQDWARGGPLRFLDHAPGRLIGLETAGWAFAEGDDFGVYHVEQPEHFLFHVPNETRLAAGSTFGHGPDGALPRAIGHEWDLTERTLLEMTPSPPPGEAVPTPDAAIQVIATGRRKVRGKLDAYLDYFARQTDSLDGLSAEMIYWERPQGGRIFNAGACAAAWVLSADPAFSKLLANVFHHFGIAAPRP